MNLKQTYPNIFSGLDDDIDEVRYLVVVDKNYDDEDSDEFDAIDPEDYNYLVYITERLQTLFAEGGMVALAKYLESHSRVDLFYLSEIDLYGIQTEMTQKQIEQMILQYVEELLL